MNRNGYQNGIATTAISANGHQSAVPESDFECFLQRLDRLAPNWSHAIHNIVQIGEFVVATASLRMKGATRGGIGTGRADSEAGIKKAERDALQRAALKFGIVRDLFGDKEAGGDPCDCEERSSRSRSLPICFHLQSKLRTGGRTKPTQWAGGSD